MADEQGEKTEQPSAKKLKDARERGQMARSRDLGVAAASLAATGILVSFGGSVIHQLLDYITGWLVRMGSAPVQDLQPGDMTGFIIAGSTVLAFAVGPIALAAAAATVMTAVAQGGFNVAPKAIEINWDRLNPSTGFRRLGFKQSGVDTIKMMLTVAVVAILSWQAGWATTVESVRFPWMAPTAAAQQGWFALTRLLWQAGLALAAIGGFDYGLQRWRHTSSLKMSKQEVKDEARSNEGNPEIKARVRRVQRDMVRRRMLQATKKATVVVTNPTHVAVALEYRRDKGAAPIVVAKGRDLVAAKIREIAREHAVPIIENPPLARALYKGAEVGDTIPPDLFGAVAEVLAYLVRIKQLML